MLTYLRATEINDCAIEIISSASNSFLGFVVGLYSFTRLTTLVFLNKFISKIVKSLQNTQDVVR